MTRIIAPWMPRQPRRRAAGLAEAPGDADVLYAYRSDDVDGEENATIADGYEITSGGGETWRNGGSVADADLDAQLALAATWHANGGPGGLEYVETEVDADALSTPAGTPDYPILLGLTVNAQALGSLNFVFPFAGSAHVSSSHQSFVGTRGGHGWLAREHGGTPQLQNAASFEADLWVPMMVHFNGDDSFLEVDGTVVEGALQDATTQGDGTTWLGMKLGSGNHRMRFRDVRAYGSLDHLTALRTYLTARAAGDI